MIIRLDDIKIDVKYSEVIYMLDNNILKGHYGKYYINKNSDFKFLFNNNLSKKKKYRYVYGMIDANFTCSICGKKHSYYISPKINEEGQVDFNTIVCCCKKCRNEKMEKKNIKTPIFKKPINWRLEHTKISNDIREYNIPLKKQKHYRYLVIKRLILMNYSNLILPISDEKHNKNIKSFNITNVIDKRNFKKKLYKEFNCSCPVCGKTHIPYKEFTIDHIIARKLGGQDNTSNFLGMCYDCNQKKGHKTVMEFLCTTELKHLPNKVLYIAKLQQEEAKILLDKVNKEIFKLENNI